MARKRKRIHFDFSSEASIDNLQIKVDAVTTSNSRVDAVITSSSVMFYSMKMLPFSFRLLLVFSIGSFYLGLRPSCSSCFTYAPLNVKQWRNVEKKEVDKMIERTTEKMIGMKNDTTLSGGNVTLTNDEIVLEVLGHKSGYFKGPSKFLSFEDSVLSKHLEERVEYSEKFDYFCEEFCPRASY
ncbi:hypothetical protein D8674_037468 [Pyrus ussuriensis x Pyrus communis]|uniref:Uncharacterized protein n=1 Tax=Pyrus ussuriensis x Pyrus communis TaxID=2448454 RepID=A0A5N5H1E2_9ROSA|nr:hypothetical protein D8674_037468 [Pyrus ussuriensis x Pyrus communis]